MVLVVVVSEVEGKLHLLFLLRFRKVISPGGSFTGFSFSIFCFFFLFSFSLFHFDEKLRTFTLYLTGFPFFLSLHVTCFLVNHEKLLCGGGVVFILFFLWWWSCFHFIFIFHLSGFFLI